MAKKDEPASYAERMFRLYKSDTYSSGRFDPRTERAWQPDEALTVELLGGHLQGLMGVGGVPTDPQGLSHWAVIDLDNHGSDEDLPIDKVDKYLVDNKIPGIPCRSKSGGIHVYFFFSQSQPSNKIQGMLSRLRDNMGYKDHEVFPKQTSLGVNSKTGKQVKGNWVNFPYFGALAKPGTNRYAVRDGKRLTLPEFLDLADKLRMETADVKSHIRTEHAEAPPCVQKMLSDGVPVGHRNEALYNITVYLRKSNPDGYEAEAQGICNYAFNKPLPRAEAMRTINSASRSECMYRCNEEPSRSLCEREECLKRKHGISAGDAERLETMEALPLFSDLVKHLSEPIRWEFSIDSVRVYNISTEDLLDWRSMRQIIAERLTKVVPLIKNVEWERVLQPLMSAARIMDVPDDASVSGVMRDRLREFAMKTDLDSRGDDIEARKALLRGLPVVTKVDGLRCVTFRAQDFIAYLRRTRSEDLKGVNLWFAIKNMGVFNTKMRAGAANINVWCMPVDQLVIDDVEPPEFKTEL